MASPSGACGTAAASAPPSSPDPLDLAARLLQLGDEALASVALGLGAPSLDRPVGRHGAALLAGGGGNTPSARPVRARLTCQRRCAAARSSAAGAGAAGLSLTK